MSCCFGCCHRTTLQRSCTYNPAVFAQAAVVRQAEDRAHRHGQQSSSVNVYFLCARGTSDDRRSHSASGSSAPDLLRFNVTRLHARCILDIYKGTCDERG